MPLLSLKNITYSVGEFPLLDHVNLEVALGERITLIGRNGEGKSTLMKIISQELIPEGGEVQKSSYVKVSRLAQELPALEETTVYEAVAHGLVELSDLLVQYHYLISQDKSEDKSWLNEIHQIQQKIDQQDGWQIQQRVERIIQALSLPADMKMSELSGGWRRRVALAQALVQEPDVLLLDEPTNHLDLAAIQWLENFLLNYPKTLIFITHDRALLRKIATRIVELDRGNLTSYPPDYDKYLERKAQALADEERHNALFDKKLSEEEQWLRQGIKARRTRNEGRVRALKALREERKLRRVRQEKPTFELNDPQTKGKMAIQAIDVSFAYDPAKPLVNEFSFNIQRGDKIAIIGPNGTGKTTLIKLLCGLLTPTQGKIIPSPANQIAFFDQNRSQLDANDTVMGNVVEGSDYIEIQGKKKHIIGYLGDFLFSPAKCRSPARVLSGGEQNRLLLAKLFSKPANILVLDEPTNDLDIETLDVLEDLLLNYPGTILIISHDREFIDNIATHCLAFEGNGKISINVGGYSDWLARHTSTTEKEKNTPQEKEEKKTPLAAKTQKLNFNEQRELTQLPAKIEQLETKITEIQSLLADPQFYTKNKDEIEQTTKTLAHLEQELTVAYKRWEDLEARQ